MTPRQDLRQARPADPFVRWRIDPEELGRSVRAPDLAGRAHLRTEHGSFAIAECERTVRTHEQAPEHFDVCAGLIVPHSR